MAAVPAAACGRRIRGGAASEAVLHEAALGSMARGAPEKAIGFAVRAAAMSPLDENHQALLIRLYRMAGHEDAAAKQLAAYAKVLGAELGVSPGPAVQAAMRTPRYIRDELADDTTIAAIAEAGSAAVSAGAVEAGVDSLRTRRQARRPRRRDPAAGQVAAAVLAGEITGEIAGEIAVHR